MKKRIALDLDGVCYNYSATACYLLNTYKGYNLDWTHTDSSEWLKEQVKNNDWQWLWTGGIKEGLFRYGNLFKGAVEGIKELAKVGEIVVITSRPKVAAQDTYDWLSYMKIPASEVHIMQDRSKAEIAPDIAIDDSPKNILQYLDANIPTVVYDHKYNQGVLGGYRAKTWLDVVDTVKNILHG